jgi:hypothetical protein
MPETLRRPLRKTLAFCCSEFSAATALTIAKICAGCLPTTRARAEIVCLKRQTRSDRRWAKSGNCLRSSAVGNKIALSFLNRRSNGFFILLSSGSTPRVISSNGRLTRPTSKSAICKGLYFFRLPKSIPPKISRLGSYAVWYSRYNSDAAPSNLGLLSKRKNSGTGRLLARSPQNLRPD